MAQESTALNTQNSSSGGMLAALGNFIGGLAQPAANLYTLKLQGDQLKQQTAAQLAAAQTQATAATAQQTQTQANTTKWMIWGGLALAAVVVLALVFRRRR